MTAATAATPATSGRNLEHLSLTTSLTAGGALLAAAGVVYLLRESLPPLCAGLWLSAVALTVVLRLLTVRQYRRRLDNGETPSMLTFDYPLVLVGLTWSIGALTLPQTAFGEMLMMTCLFGLVAGAVAGFASHLRGVLCVALSSVLPFSSVMLLHDDAPHRVDGHHLHRRQLIGCLHQADFRSERRAGASGEQQRGDDGSELFHQGERRKRAHRILGIELGQVRIPLQTKDAADKQAADHDDDE